jgi:polysaccharide export outer membrane protein
MNQLFPRYRNPMTCDRRIHPASGRLGASLLAASAIFLIGAFGYPQTASAQHDAAPLGSQPAVVPASLVPATAATPEAQKVDAPKVEQSKADTPKPGNAKDAPASPAGGALASPASAGGKAYIIGPNDILQVSVWNQPQLSKMVDVHLDGMISIQLAGEIKAEGLTTAQLRDVIARRLEEVALTTPLVDVSVLKINSKHYYVYGGVLRGGEFVLAERTTIMDALALTGFKDSFARTDKIELRRGKEKFPFNYKDFIKGKNMDKNINRELQDGDQIIVPE